MVQYTVMMLLEEMASIFLTPYLLLFIVPKVIFVLGDLFLWPKYTVFHSNLFSFILQRVDDILQYIADFTVNVEGVGHVCRLAWTFCFSSFMMYISNCGHSLGLLSLRWRKAVSQFHS